MIEGEMEGRLAFDRWRGQQRDAVPWDWADMSDWEKRRWVSRARGEEPMPDPRGGAPR